jgi:membrane-bound metal-dependent hydrolase YbcI (DUF457 family)
MPLPLAHGLMGATVIALCHRRQDGHFNWRNWRNWRPYALGFWLAVAPDFDCGFKWLPFAPFAGRGWHHDFTHSLGFALLCGCLVAWLLHRREDYTRQAYVYTAAMATHPLLDWLFTASSGVELLWPFYHERLRLGVTPPMAYVWHHHSMLGRAFDLTQLVLVELVLYGSLFLLVWWFGQMPQRKVKRLAR